MALSKEAVSKLAQDLMSKHGLAGWRFQFDHARTRLGACDYRKKVLSLSRHLLTQEDFALVRETLLHEIAHAQVGPGRAHDAVWLAAAQALGIEGDVTYRGAADQEIFPRPRWALVCQHCGTVVAERHRRRMRIEHYACARCGPGVGTLAWKSN